MSRPPGPAGSEGPACRLCRTPLRHTVVDLGMSPLCESYRSASQLNEMEPFYPLRVQVCERCLLVQLPEYVSAADIFTEYAYFSSYSSSWVEHARRYCEAAAGRLGLGGESLVVELASNDGYLLQHFASAGIRVLGIDPAGNIAAAAAARGVPTLTEFFGASLARRLAAEGIHADLLVANNVLAQVPDLHDFAEGMRLLLNSCGVATVEFPHLSRLFGENQFDTIYHEHFSYFSLLSAQQVFAAHGLFCFDVEELSTHGGSLRLWLRHQGAGGGAAAAAVAELEARERAEGLDGLDAHLAFSPKVERLKRRLLSFLIEAKDRGCQTVGYGAPGKGNTLLNYCGIRTDLLAYTVDRNPYKQGLFLPGTHIPVHEPARIEETKPDYVLVLPWNLRDEILEQLDFVRSWGGRLVFPIPDVEIL